jgi:hypothetical protein
MNKRQSDTSTDNYSSKHPRHNETHLDTLLTTLSRTYSLDLEQRLVELIEQRRLTGQATEEKQRAEERVAAMEREMMEQAKHTTEIINQLERGQSEFEETFAQMAMHITFSDLQIQHLRRLLDEKARDQQEVRIKKLESMLRKEKARSSELESQNRDAAALFVSTNADLSFVKFQLMEATKQLEKKNTDAKASKQAEMQEPKQTTIHQSPKQTAAPKQLEDVLPKPRKQPSLLAFFLPYDLLTMLPDTPVQPFERELVTVGQGSLTHVKRKVVQFGLTVYPSFGRPDSLTFSICWMGPAVTPALLTSIGAGMAVGSTNAQMHYMAVELQVAHVAQATGNSNFANFIQRLFDNRPARIVRLNEHHITINPTKCAVCSAIRDGQGVKWRWVA